MGTVRILFFASAKETVGLDTLELAIETPISFDRLQTAVYERFPNLLPLKPYLRWAASTFCFYCWLHSKRWGRSCDYSACIRRVSMYLTYEPRHWSYRVGLILVQWGRLDIHWASSRPHRRPICDPLDYEAYEPMAERVLGDIIQNTKSQYPGISVALKHRLGRLGLTDVAVIIAVGAPHRSDAFDACRAIIETLKTDVPIFKKEFRGNGSVWVGMGS